MRRAILSLTLPLLLVAGASRANAGGLDVRIGCFLPRGNETLFQDLNSLYTPNGDPSRGVTGDDFNGVFGGAEYNMVVAPNLEVGFSVDGFGQSVDTSYRDYVRPGGTEIRQTLKLSMVPVGVTLRILPTSKRLRLVPYAGGGVDAVFYTYEEYGDFIDFYDPELPVIPDAFRAEGTAFGVHALGGLRVYVNRDFAITGEARYQWAEDEMGDDFLPNEPGLINRIDLSGWTFTVGLHVRF